MPPRLERARARRLRAALLRWYRASARELPWRRSTDPYAIWISETMLQQTRVETVIPYYEAFLRHFPTVEALAVADREAVYAQWAGLGYYSRARNLHRAASEIVERFDGSLPADATALESLPGIGRYTAGAVASIAFDLPEPVVDGNVERVLSRLLGLRGEIKSREVRDALWEAAGALARGDAPGDLNQALMELGATLCTPRSPDCPACPVRRSCDARRVGDAETLPRKTRKTKARPVQAAAVWLERRGRVLAVKRRDGGLLGGLWGPPGVELAARQAPEGTLREHLADTLGLEVEHLRAVGELRHVFTHRDLRLHVFHAEVARGRLRAASFEAHRWLAPSALRGLPQSALSRKALALLPAPHRATARGAQVADSR